jgi:hypothetical protein
MTVGASSAFSLRDSTDSHDELVELVELVESGLWGERPGVVVLP